MTDAIIAFLMVGAIGAQLYVLWLFWDNGIRDHAASLVRYLARKVRR
jgi:hypothetical protein